MEKLFRTVCHVAQIPETEIEQAFIRIYNKLQQGKEQILIPMFQMLSELRKVKNQSNEKYTELTNQLKEIGEQSHMLSSLRAKGIIDSAFAISQQTELNGKMAKAKKAKEQLLMAEENDAKLVNTKMLIMTLEKNKSVMVTFDEAIFKNMVSSIKAMPNGKLTFNLKL